MLLNKFVDFLPLGAPTQSLQPRTTLSVNAIEQKVLPPNHSNRNKTRGLASSESAVMALVKKYRLNNVSNNFIEYTAEFDCLLVLFAKGLMDVRPYECAARFFEASYSCIRKDRCVCDWDKWLVASPEVKRLFSELKGGVDANSGLLKQALVPYCGDKGLMVAGATSGELGKRKRVTACSEPVPIIVSTNPEQKRAKKQLGLLSAAANKSELASVKQIDKLSGAVKAYMDLYPGMKAKTEDYLRRHEMSYLPFDTATALCVLAEPDSADGEKRLEAVFALVEVCKKARLETKKSVDDLSAYRIGLSEARRKSGVKCDNTWRSADTKVSECNRPGFDDSLILESPLYDRNDVWRFFATSEEVWQQHQRLFQECYSKRLYPKKAGDSYKGCSPPIGMSRDDVVDKTAVELVVVTLTGDLSDYNTSVYMDGMSVMEAEFLSHTLCPGKKYVTWRLNPLAHSEARPSKASAHQKVVNRWHSDLLIKYPNACNGKYLESWKQCRNSVDDATAMPGVSVVVLPQQARDVGVKDWGTDSLFSWIIDGVHKWSVSLRTYAPYGFNHPLDNKYHREMTLGVPRSLWSPGALTFLKDLQRHKEEFAETIEKAFAAVHPIMFAIHTMCVAFNSRRFELLPKLFQDAFKAYESNSSSLLAVMDRRESLYAQVTAFSDGLDEFVLQLNASNFVKDDGEKFDFDFIQQTVIEEDDAPLAFRLFIDGVIDEFKRSQVGGEAFMRCVGKYILKVGGRLHNTYYDYGMNLALPKIPCYAKESYFSMSGCTPTEEHLRASFKELKPRFNKEVFKPAHSDRGGDSDMDLMNGIRHGFEFCVSVEDFVSDFYQENVCVVEMAKNLVALKD